MNSHRMTAIVPCNDIDASQRFYARLGFRVESDYGDYRLLTDDHGGTLHLRKAELGWLTPGSNPFGLYFYVEDVDAVAAPVRDLWIHPPREQPWGTYEFAISDPDETLVRIGRVSRKAP